MGIRGPYESGSSKGLPRTLGERIRMLRVQRGWTQSDLGDALSTDQATVSLWERDRAKPSGAGLVGVAAAFGVSVQALETGEGLLLEALPALPEGGSNPSEPAPNGLPPASPGSVVAVDLRSRGNQTVEAMEAMAFLMRAMKDGRTVWIVAE